MDGGRPTLAAQLAQVKKGVEDKPSARGRPTDVGTRPRRRSTSRRTPRTSASGKLDPVESKTNGRRPARRSGAGQEEKKTEVRGRRGRRGSSSTKDPKPPAAKARGGRAPRGGRGGAKGRAPAAKKVGPREVAEKLVEELEKLLLWNREAGLPKDEATRILKEATKLVDEMEMMRERVDKGVSYNPSYAEKQFRKIIKPCRGVLREARDALAKRAYTMTHRARNKLTKLVAHNEAAGAPDDEATEKILAAEAAVAFAEECEKKKDAAEDDDDEVTDAFIKAAHDAKLAVDAVGLAMRDRIKHELDAATDLLHAARERVNGQKERNDGVGAPEGAATDAVNAALAAVEKAEEAFETMDENPDTLEFVTEFITAADSANAACDKADKLLAEREQGDFNQAIADAESLAKLLEHLERLHSKHRMYRATYAPPDPSPPKRRMQKSKSRRRVSVSPEPPKRPGDLEDTAATKAMKVARESLDNLNDDMASAKASKGGDNHQANVITFVQSAHKARGALNEARDALRAAIAYDHMHAKQHMAQDIDPDFERLRKRASSAYEGEGASAEDAASTWKVDYESAVQEYDTIHALCDKVERAQAEESDESKDGAGGTRLEFCDSTFEYIDKLDAWAAHIRQADAALSAFDANTVDTSRAQLLQMAQELKQALEVADALGLGDDTEERRLLREAQAAVDECDALASKLEEGGVTPAEATQFALAVSRCSTVVTPAVDAVKRAQITYYSQWTTIITTVTTEVTTMSESVDMGASDTDDAAASLMKAQQACKAASKAGGAVAEELNTRREQKGGRRGSSGVTFLLNAGLLTKMRKAKEDAVAARNKAAAGLKRKENARVQRAADEFRKLRTSVQHLQVMHKGWAGATGRTATRLRGDAKFAAASGDNVSGLASSVGSMKQLLATFTELYENPDSDVAEVLAAGKAFRDAVGAAHTSCISTRAAFEERDTTCIEESRTVYTTVTETIEYLTTRYEATQGQSSGEAMYISPDPDSKGKPPKRQDLEAREAQATRDGEVLSTAKSRVAALGKALHELQTNGDDADAAEYNRMILACSAAADAASDSISGAADANKRRQAALISASLTNAANARLHLEALKKLHGATADADNVSDQGDEVWGAIETAEKSVATSEAAAARLQALVDAGDDANANDVGAALDELTEALAPVPEQLAEVSHQLHERETALYMSSKHELTTLTTTITELRHRHTSAGSPDDDAGAALTKAEADVKAAQESLARLEAIDRGSNPAAWRTALVEFSQLVSGVAAGSVRDANTAADMRDASSTKGAKELLETTKGIMQHVMERNRKYGAEGDEAWQLSDEANRMIAECEDLEAQIEAAKAAGNRELETELATKYMTLVQQASVLAKPKCVDAVKRREEAIVVDYMSDLGALKTKLAGYDKQNAEDGEPDDDATRLLREAHELYNAADAARDQLRRQSSNEDSIDSLVDHMKPLQDKMVEVKAAFAERRDAGFAKVTKDLEAVRARIAAAVARNEADGRPDDAATAEVDSATAALAQVDALLEQLNSGDANAVEHVKSQFVAAVANSGRVADKAEAALQRRSQSTIAAARALLTRTSKRLKCLEARNHVAGDPDDEATDQLRQVRASHDGLQEMVKLGVVGGAEDTGNRDGGIVLAVRELAEAVESSVVAVSQREMEALDEAQDTTVACNKDIDVLQAEHIAWGSPDDEAARALATAEAEESATRQLRVDLGKVAVHPALKRHMHRVMSKQGSLMNISPLLSDPHAAAEDNDEDTWVDGAKEVMQVITQVDKLKRAVETAKTAFRIREEESAKNGVTVEAAHATLVDLRRRIAQLEARNRADGTPDDEATQLIRDAAEKVVAANTTEQLLKAAPNTKVIKDQFVAVVPEAEELVRMAEEATNRRAVSIQLEKVEALGRGVTDNAQSLDGLTAQVDADDSAADAADLRDEDMIAAVAQAREAIAAARSAADDASEASRAVRASDPTLPESHAAAMADAEVARNNFDTALEQAKAKAAHVHELLQRRRKGAASTLLLDSSATVAEAQRELAALIRQNKADGEPDDEATKAIEVAQVAMFAVETMHDRIEADPTNVALHSEYVRAVSNATNLVSAASTAMQERKQRSGGALAKTKALLAAAQRQLADLKKVNTEAGIPVDEATEAIDHAMRNLSAAQVLQKLVEQPRGVTASLVDQYKAAAAEACESVDAATALMQARGMRQLGNHSTSEVAMNALRRLFDTEVAYQKTYRIFDDSQVLRKLPVVVQIMNVATEDLGPARELRKYVFAACGTTSEHDAATKLQATFRGHHDRRKVESITASNKEVEALKAAAEEGAAVRAEMDAAAARLQAVARGRKARAGQHEDHLKVLPSELALDKPVDDSVLSRVTQAQLAKVPTQTLIQFVDSVSRAETAVNEAFRVITSQVQRQQVLHNTATSERQRAVELLMIAKNSLKAAQAGYSQVQMDAKTTKPTPEAAKQIAAAGVAVQRAEKAVARAQRALDSFDEQVAPTVPDMIALVSATSEAKAVSEVAADAVEALGLGLQEARHGAEMGQRKAQVLAQSHAQLEEAARVLEECERDLARLRRASAHSNKNDVEGLAAIEGAEQAVKTARAAHRSATEAYDRARDVDPTQHASSAILDQCLVKAAKARVLAVAAARHTQTARQHYNMVGGVGPQVVTKQEGDAVARLELAKLQLEKHEKTFRSMGDYSGNPDLLIVHDMILVAKNELRGGHLQLVKYRSAQAKYEVGDDDGESKGVPSDADLQDSMNQLTLQVSKAVWAVDAVGRQLQLLSMTGYGSSRNLHAHHQWLHGVQASRQPFVDQLTAGRGSRSLAVALVDGTTHSAASRYRPLYRTPNASRNNAGLDLATSRRLLSGTVSYHQRWMLLSRYRAKLYRVGRLHGDLLSLMHARNLMVMPVSIGRKVQAAILNANRDLKVADKVVPSRKERGQGPPSIADLRKFERVVRIARFKVYRFEYELQVALVLLEQRRQKGLHRTGTWHGSASSASISARSLQGQQSARRPGTHGGEASDAPRPRPPNSSSSNGHKHRRRHKHRRHRRRRHRDDDDDGYSDYGSEQGSQFSGYAPSYGYPLPGPAPPPGAQAQAAAYGQQAFNNYWQMQMEREYAAYKAQRSAQEAAMMGVPAGGGDPYAGMGGGGMGGGMGMGTSMGMGYAAGGGAAGAAPLGTYYNNVQNGQSMYGMGAAGEAMAGGGMHGTPGMMGHTNGAVVNGGAGAGAGAGAGPDHNPLEPDGDFKSGDDRGADEADMTALFAAARKTPPKRVRPHHGGSSRRSSKASRTRHVAARPGERDGGDGETLEVEYASDLRR